MGRIKSLNGIPNEVVQKFLSTMMYQDKGYMADWIWKRMNELKIAKAEIDLFSETTIPPELKNKPLIANLFELRELIQKELITKHFEPSFINSGHFKISIDNLDNPYGLISIQCILKTSENRQLYGKTYQEKAYPIANSFFKKILTALKII